MKQHSATPLPSRRIRHVVIRAKATSWRVRWSFLLFTFTLPFQATDLAFMSGSVSLAKISGLLFFAFYFLDHSSLSSLRKPFPRPPKAMWWFVAYLAVYTLNGLFVSGEFFGLFVSRFTTLVQLVVLFWFASDLLTDEKMSRDFLFTYSISVLIFAIGFIVHVPGFSVTADADRVTALGDNPNAVAQMMAQASIMLIGVGFNTKQFRKSILLSVLILPFIAVMVETGSRGGVLAFVSGCFIYGLFFWRSKQGLATILLGALCFTALIYVAIRNPVFSERMEDSYYGGSLAGREEIYPTAIDMILEQPVFGWHPVESTYQLNSRLGWKGESRDTHNLILWVLLEVGLIGAVPFFVGLWLCGRAAWRVRVGSLGVLPLALFTTMLVANMSGTGIIDKEFWLILALAVAAEFSLSKKSRRRLAQRMASRHAA
jgi:O-antigen ligase